NIMWAASMALNGLIGAGVPQDWATHMIGHELTGAYGIDHARTLSIVLPAILKIRTEAKRDKLLQYAERVWQLTDGTEAVRIQRAIELTEEFFVAMQLPTRLMDVNLDETHIDGLIESLTQHGMVQLGEHGDITPDVSREILRLALV
ncbi:iron-containing alcohol dehydrogenase, partial [Reinekea sp.]